jgi:hypothetical protein
VREMWVARAARLIAIAHRLSGSRPVRMWLAGILAALIVAGCSTGATSSPSVAATAGPTGTASPTATPSEVLSASKSPTATLAPLTFVATGSLQTARDGATATLLADGKILVAGGEVDMTALDVDYFVSAELYDPATGRFTQTGSMSAARSGAIAIRLADGRVLIAGGDGCDTGRACTDVPARNAIASAEIYDPATGKFTRTGPMGEALRDRPAVLLRDGRVFVASYAKHGDLYDPSTGKFNVTNKETSSSGAGTATLLPNGKVLVTGASLSQAELFDPSSAKYSSVSIALSAGTPIAQFDDQYISRATLLPDGRVLLFENGYLETYDPASGVCVFDGSVSGVKEWLDATATLLANGSILFAGGVAVASAAQATNTNAAVVYDAADGSIRTGHMQATRVFHTATALSDDTVLIAGGYDADGNPLASAELFKP